jgi:hypothetical protein
MKIWRGISWKWRIIIGVLIACICLGTSAAFAGGVLKVSFGGGAIIEGNIHVSAPDPVASDLVITVPDINITTGQPKSGNIDLQVTNNSKTDLIYQDATFTFPPEVGTIELADLTKNIAVAKGSTQTIILFYTTKADIPEGNYKWSGEITYGW